MSVVKIGDLVEIPPVRTVIQLEEGRLKSAEIAESFIFTNEVASHCTVIAAALLNTRGQGYFLQGDFGSGKSHFLAALYAWLAAEKGGHILSEGHGGLKRLSESKAKFLPVDISLINYRAAVPLEQIIIESVEKALTLHGKKVDLVSMISSKERHETFNRVISSVRSAGFDGLVLLIDELSEFFRSKPSTQVLNEDARTLQLLGEMTSGEPLWIICAVQESIERTGDISQAIFRKIKDRFPIKLTLSTVHIRSLISGRLVRRKQGADEEIYRIHEMYRHQFPTFSSSLDDFKMTYPVHPRTISLLDGLGDLFSQHRGVVDFVYSRIAGDSRRNIPSILDRPAPELLAPDSIYDHFAGRLAEFSSFNIYPRHIIPHLDEVIDRELESREDISLAKRLVRMLVLYKIHPTASEPTTAELGELAACSLDFQSPQMNALFISETLLDPVAASSRFLRKQPVESADPMKAIYKIVTEDDPGKTLDARIKRLAGELQEDDSRLLIAALAGLQESESWPGRALLERGVQRLVNWNSSTRKVFICFLYKDDEKDFSDRLAHRIDSEKYDFAVVMTIGTGKSDCEHTAVWQIPLPGKESILKEFLGAKLTLQELKPVNPAEAPLIPMAQEKLKRLAPAACQAALEALYSGDFTDRSIRVDTAVRQLKRFDRLLEAAAEVILSNRYPRFREVAPRRFTPSPRSYLQLLDDFIIPGSISLSEARSRSLSAAIDGLAVPLGLVELKRGSYIFSPDTRGHPLLSFFFGLLNPSGATPVPGLLAGLESGPFGVPRDTALFLLASLTAGGLITARKGGRSIPLEFLTLNSLEKAEEITLGELINEHDLATLTEECTFLASSSGWESFGLRQQRETWKELIKFRDTTLNLAQETRSDLSRIAEYSSFKAFDIRSLDQKLNALDNLVKEIKVSYSAREGLERFLQSWRGTGLNAEDIRFVKKLNRFLSIASEEFVAINHYVRHQAVSKAAEKESAIEELGQAVLKLLKKPETGVVNDSGEHLGVVFSHFRDHYIALYAKEHNEYYISQSRAPLAKNAGRALDSLMRLARIETLDRPPGIDEFIREMNAPDIKQCTRQISEELMRSPVCSCGFQPGDRAEIAMVENPEEKINRYLESYIEILRNPKVLESLAVRSYALQDVNPGIAGRLKELGQTLKSGKLKASTLTRTIDVDTAAEISQSLAGRISIHNRKLSDLVNEMAGRRLPPERVSALFREWLAGTEPGQADREPDEEILIAIEDDSLPRSESGQQTVSWWPLLHSELFGVDSAGQSPNDRQETGVPDEIKRIEMMLEEQFPSAGLKEPLELLDSESLYKFISTEKFHSQAVRSAWVILAERILNGSSLPENSEVKSLHALPERAESISNSLERAKLIHSGLALPYPERLAVRIPVSKLISDPWTTRALKEQAFGMVDELACSGEKWLSELSPVPPISLEERALVIIVDGVSPDLWLEAMDKIELLPGTLSRKWARLEAEPFTSSSIAGLFGFKGDPVEEFALRDILYFNLSGDEEHSLIDHVLPLDSGKCAVIRLALIDRAAHSGELRLADMAGILKNIIEKELPSFCRLCKEQKRPLILTTDHGLSLTRDGLKHGKGGAYERTIFRAEWLLP